MQQTFLKFWFKMQSLKDAFVHDESGQDLVEYALVAALIALAATAGMTSVATSLSGAFTSIGTKLTAATS